MAPYLDAINATDNTSAPRARLAARARTRDQGCGEEPVLQLVCRDRNRLALQSEIVGAALHGIENICCLTGDDVTAGDEPEARRVFDLDGPQLLATARGISEGRYLSGRPLEPAPHLFLGAVENPGAPPFEQRVERALEEGPRRRTLPPAAGLLRARAGRGLRGRGGARGLTERRGAAPSV